MKRNEWEVPYSGERLAEAAENKMKYHEGRRAWWATKRDEVIEKIRSDGITVTDTIVDELAKLGYANTTMGRGGPTVQIDEGLQAHLAEAHDKMKTHASLVKQYDAWNQMASAHPNMMFALQHDDWMFFFGH